MTYISWSSDYVIYLEDYLIEKCRNAIPWISVPCDMKSDLKIYVGQFDLYFMGQ